MPYFLNNKFKNNEFELMSKDKYFVDKTGLISKINNLIGIKDRFVCITRPRRFGKTLNAMMLASYYSKNANCRDIFDKLEISKENSYLEHLNKHNVIYMTFNQIPSPNCSYEEFINRYVSMICDDLKEEYNDININNNMIISDVFNAVYNQTGKGFIFILDEWDYIFNNNLFSENYRKSFLKFLEDLLKDKPYVDLAYMTGVLPIAKYSAGSALNMFLEFNIMNDYTYDKYFGFTNSEVETLCKKQDRIPMESLKDWYNGYYTCNNLQIYNPRSVTTALRQGVCQSYWTNTGPMDEIIYYINNNIGEVKDDIVSMVSGIPLEIKLKGYSAEQKELNTRNQILSAMTIYGFLSYHNKTLEIPNKELRIKFDEALEDRSMGEVAKLVLKSNEMLKATFRKDTEKMAEILEEAHDINIPVIKYNDENSLSCVVMLSYLSARDDYNIIREMPSGKGFADFIFYPNDKSKPAFILELKKNSTPEEALKQIREKKYALALRNYTGTKFAVGISWDKKTKEHKIKIEDIV
ncbi:MAG: AAA family ATPase [Clostridia bacterium]|nr:AAA family ATPase [Clostridia bacterium]